MLPINIKCQTIWTIQCGTEKMEKYISCYESPPSLVFPAPTNWMDEGYSVGSVKVIQCFLCSTFVFLRPYYFSSWTSLHTDGYGVHNSQETGNRQSNDPREEENSMLWKLDLITLVLTMCRNLSSSYFHPIPPYNLISNSVSWCLINVSKPPLPALTFLHMIYDTVQSASLRVSLNLQNKILLAENI